MASQTLNSSIQPTDVYGGDEVSAIVLDPGSSSVRAGFAGEDSPKSFVNSHYGVVDGRSIFGDDTIHNPLAGLDIRNPMSKDGIVEDWDAAIQLWEYAITSRLTSFKPSDPRTNGLNPDLKDIDMEMEGVEEGEKALEEHPLLMTETAWNSTKNREKSIEIAMESWGCPAFWFTRDCVLAAFGAGKATALVIDVGASKVSVIAVHDGLFLKKSVQKAPIGGSWLSSQLRSLFSSTDPKIDIVPHFMIASKTQVDAGAPAQATYRKYDTEPTPSFRALEEERVLTEFKESVVQVWSPPRISNQTTTQPGAFRLSGGPLGGPSNVDTINSSPGRVFEFPDGSNQMWGIDRYNVTEGMFDEKAALPVPGEPAITKAQTLPEMVKACLNGVDTDLKGHLLGNIVITGGGSLVNGFVERTEYELNAVFPGAKIRIQAAPIVAERRFGAWIGGSILGSLGTFHQMWISKKEYEEFGANVVEKRCK